MNDGMRLVKEIGDCLREKDKRIAELEAEVAALKFTLAAQQSSGYAEQKVSDLPMPTRSKNALLARYGSEITLRELAQIPKQELVELDWFGSTAYAQLKQLAAFAGIPMDR